MQRKRKGGGGVGGGGLEPVECPAGDACTASVPSLWEWGKYFVPLWNEQ